VLAAAKRVIKLSPVGDRVGFGLISSPFGGSGALGEARSSRVNVSPHC